MKLTSKEAKEILENERGKTKSDRWIDHCICVGDSAGKIAKALNEKGEEFVLEGEGLLARAVLHENDHLNGVLYVDLAK